MQCKKALVAANGNIEEAANAMRKSGQAQAVKKGTRVAAEGIVIVKTQDNNVALVEINSETDFVARDESFKTFADKVAEIILKNDTQDIEAISDLAYDNDQTIEEARQTLIGNIGENIKIRRAARVNTSNSKAAYTHGNKIGVFVELKGGDDTMAKDIAMHIAAMNPMYILPEEIDNSLVEKEKEIIVAQTQASGKPPEIIEKMVEGRIRKFKDEISLTGQPFVKDNKQTVGLLLNNKQASVVQFVRFEVGEGIEKETVDFAKEVMDQVKGA